jgi:hypothetical protein
VGDCFQAPSVHSNMSGLSLPDDASVMSGYLTEEQQQRFVNLPYFGGQPSETMLDPHAFAAAIPEVISLLADEDPVRSHSQSVGLCRLRSLAGDRNQSDAYGVSFRQI